MVNYDITLQHQEINQIIDGYEKNLKIEVLFWCVHGSRGVGRWCRASDYDIAFVYISKDNENKVSFIHEIKQDYGMDALDLDDVFVMLKKHYSEFNQFQKEVSWDSIYEKSIPGLDYRSIFHWVKSPVIVSRKCEFDTFLCKMEDLFYDKDVIQYYFARMVGNYSNYLQGDEVLVHRYLRTFYNLFTCRWILDKKQMAPMLLFELIKDYKNEKIVDDVYALAKVYQKASCKSLKIKKRIDFNIYIEKQMYEINTGISGLDYNYKNWFDVIV